MNLKASTFVLPLALAAACSPSERTGHALRASGVCGDGARLVNLTLEVTDANGEPIPVSEDTTQVTVDSRAPGGSYEPVSELALYFEGPRIDAVLIADNSGSEVGELEPMKQAVDAFADAIIDHGQGDQVGLVRVSSEASVLAPLTGDAGALDAAIDDMFISNGWTSLWDGIVAGNGLLVEADGGCVPDAYRSIVMFTDGRDNRSAATDQDVRELEVAGARTPVHAIGIGSQTDDDLLAGIAQDTGGQYQRVADTGELVDALLASARGMAHVLPVSFRVDSCDHTQARIAVVLDDGDTDVSLTLTIPLPACD